MYYKKHEGRLPTFQSSAGYCLMLWALKIEIAHSCSTLVAVLKQGFIDGCVSKKALSMKISALGDSPIRAIEKFQTARVTWNELQTHYAGKSMVN